MATSFRGKLIKGSSIAFIGRALTLGFTLALTVLVTRNVSVEESGLYFFITSAALFSSIIGRFGIEISALRFISENIEEDRSLAYGIYWFCFKKVFKQSIVSVPILIASLEFSNFSYDIEVLVPALIFSILLTWQYYIFEASRKISGIAHSIIFGGLLLYFLTATFVFLYNYFFSLGLSVVFSLASLSLLISLTFSFYLTNKKQKSLSVTPEESLDKTLKISIEKVARPVGMKAVLAFILTNGDIWIMSFFLAPDDVAIYGAASRLVFLVSFALQIVNIVVSSEISKKSNDQSDEFENFLRASAFPPFVVSVLLALTFIFFGEFILGRLFGDAFSEGYIILAILCIGKVVNAYTGSCGYILLMKGFEKYALYSVALVGSITIILSIVLLNYWGANGVAIAFSLGLSIQQMSILYYCRSRAGVNTVASFREFKNLMGVK